MSILIRYTALLWFGLVAPLATAQIKHFINDDLPSKHIYSINQDNEGFIWILTKEGLVKFDGQKIRTFTVQDGLPTNDIWNSEVTGDKLWFMCKGKRQGYIRNDSVFSFHYLEGDFSPLSYVRTESDLMIIDEKVNLVWVEEGQWRVKKKGYFFHSEDSNYSHTSWFGELENIIVTSTSKPSRIEKSVFHFRNGQKDSIVTTGYGIRYYKLFPNNVLCYSALNEVHFVNCITGDIKSIEIPLELGENLHGNSVRFVNGSFQISCQNFFGVLDSNLSFLRKQRFSKKLNVHTALQDNQGNMWLGSFTTGLHFIPSNYSTYHTEKVGYIIHAPCSLKNAVVYASNNKLFQYGVAKPLFIADWYLYRNENRGDTLVYTTGYKNEILVYESDKSLHCKYSNGRFDLPSAHTIIGVNGYNYARNHNTVFKQEKNGTWSLAHKFVSSGLMAHKDTAFLLSNDGLYYINSQDQIKRHDYKIDMPLNAGLSIDDMLILGSNGNGVLVCTSGRVEQQLLKGATITSLYNYKDSLIICSTAKGVICLERRKNELISYKTYTVSNGLKSNIIAGVTILNDTIYVATDDGITQLPLVRPKDVEEELGNIYLCNLQWNGEHISRSFELHRKNRKENRLTIDFGSAFYSSHPEVTYHYRILPDGEEIAVDGGKFTLYSLGLGMHKIELIAKLPYMLRKSKTLTVKIEPRWFESWWFYILCVVLLSLFWYRFAKMREKKRNEREMLTLRKEVENTSFRLESLRSQMNPHFVFNSLNAIQYYITENQNDLSETYLIKFAKLIREFFDISNESSIPMSREIDLLQNYLTLEKMRFDDKLDYHFTIDDHLDINLRKVPCMLIQPIVENAVNHGIFHKEGSGNVWLEFLSLTDHEYEVIISDDGIGIANSKALKAQSIQGHKSKATQVFAERIRLLNKTMKWTIDFTVSILTEDVEHPGTVVKLHIKENDTSNLD